MSQRKGRFRAVMALVVAIALLSSTAVLISQSPAEAQKSCARNIKAPCCAKKPIREVNGHKVAKCYSPGDDRIWGAALYSCNQFGLMNGTWATPWHDVKACMEADLVVNGRNRAAVNAHFVELYMFQRGREIVEKFWRDSYLAARAIVTGIRKWAPWARWIIVYAPDVFCAATGFMAAGPYGAAAAGIGCSWAIQYLINKEGLG